MLPNTATAFIKIGGKMNFDAVLSAAGSFGPYQWMVLLFYQLAIFVISSNMLFMIFGGYASKCSRLADISESLNLNFTTGNANLSDSRLDFERHGFAADQSLNGNFSFQGNASNSFDANSTCDVYFYSIVHEWGLNTPDTKHIPGLILTFQMIGVFFGPLVGGQIADTFGRKTCMLIGFTFLLIFGTLSGFAPNWMIFAACRVLIGLFGGAVGTAHYVLFVEVVSAKWRQVTYFGGWPLGYIWLGCMAYATRNWRYLSVAVNVAGIVPILLLTFCVCESPKWLLEKNRVEDARKVFTYIARKNGSRGCQKTLDMQLDHLLINMEVNAPIATGNMVAKATKYSYHDLFRGWKRAATTTLLVYCSFATSTISYAIIFGLGKLAGDPAINTILTGLIRLPLSIIGAGLDRKVKWFGRRKLHQLGLIPTVICLITMSVLLSKNADAEKTVPYAAMSMITIGFCTLIWMATGFYHQEVFPTALRTMGNAICSCGARVGNILSAQLLILDIYWAPLPTTVMAGLALLNSVLAAFFLPETKGAPLPDLDLNKNARATMLQTMQASDKRNEFEKTQVFSRDTQ